LAGISITAIHITSIATIDLVFWVHLNVKMFIIGLWQVGFLAGLSINESYHIAKILFLHSDIMM
jgi:hypothetical protein